MVGTKSATDSTRDKITLIILAAVMSAGVAVIAGWHLHIYFLVQIIPGIITMQYNTALCFFAVGTAACGLIIKRGGRVVTLSGGVFVAGMGALVIFEYATNTSVGIDTFFFYPWKRTLSADPGRMALTSAISFLSSGGALIWLTLRPRSLTLFAVAHILPLSFGALSLMGYLLGVTYVLPFHLGSQMALHTSLAFLGYSSAMIAFAWQRSFKNEQGFPMWGLALAIIVIPILSSSFIVTSWRTLSGISAPILVSLSVISLFALAVQRLTKSRIAIKGMILISVPLMFMLVFLALLTEMKQTNERSQSLSLHSKEVIAQAQIVLTNLTDAETGIRGYLISGDPAFAEPYSLALAEAPEEIELLKALVKDNPEQKELASRIGDKANERIAILKGMEMYLRAGNRAKAIEQMQLGRGKRVMDEFRRQMAEFVSNEEQLDEVRLQGLRQSWSKFNWLLLAGGSVDVLLSVLLALLFSNGITRRLLTLTENAQRLAGSRELAEPLKGNDEIANLDQVFHKMAGALDEAARKERALVEGALDVICSVDGEGRFIKINSACHRIWGYKPAELVGRRFIELVHPDDVETTNRVAEEIMKGKPLTDFENRYIHKAGHSVHILWTANWSETDHLIFAVARDITERKRAEEETYRLNENLERYTSQLEAANKELEAFSYSVSHDLRAPLRHINGFADLLQKNGSSNLDEKSRRYLNTISDSARQMGRLIDDLLSFSRMGRAEMRRSVVNLEQLVNKVRADLESESEGRNIAWRIESLPEVYGDPSMLGQVWMNLCSNAVKYTRRRGEASIEIGSLTKDEDETVFFVRDNGAGFDMKYVDKLFGVFQRLHRADEFEGTGIGLANVRRIIHRHGGRVWAESPDEGGATFYFSLPNIRKDQL